MEGSGASARPIRLGMMSKVRSLLALFAIGAVACEFAPPSATLARDIGAKDAADLDAERSDTDSADIGSIDGTQDDAAAFTDADNIDAEPSELGPVDAIVTDGGPNCGNGVVEGSELCDDGDLLAGDGCAACAIESGWSCAGVQPSACAETCGDQMIVGDEGCDDGALADGDGCSSACAVERGYACTGLPSTCATVCGDGILLGAEICDDNDNNDGDGCDAACAPEAGFNCNGASPTTCTPVCGDSFVRGNEQCDDGGTDAGDGCARNCRVEGGFVCDGEPSDCNIWWDITFVRRRWIAVDRSGVGEALGDFPILLAITPARIDYALCEPDGSDLRFIADDQSTEIPYEIESWNPGATSYVWVRMPLIRADGTATTPDRVWMYYGGASGTTAPTEVWSDGFQTVWHLSEQPSGAVDEIRDSTDNDRRGQTMGGMNASSSVTAMIGPGLEFDGTDDQIDFGDVPTDGNEAITLEAWVRWTTGSDHVISNASGIQIAEHIFSLEVPNGSSARMRLTTNGGASGSTQLSSAAGTIVASQWQYVVATWSATDPVMRLYIDGAQITSMPRGGNTIQNSSERLVVGNLNLTLSRFFGGMLDEVRISASRRSPEWIEAQYRSMTDTLLVFGAEQIVP
jgi:cysteine-rich repeat protein